MKLILKEYLSSLKERGELDAILPDLLSQMGLNIITTPRRGVKEYGVDIAAVGSIDGEEEKLYLLSVKSGNLTRNFWDGSSDQSLRPSLNEIIDSYIPTRIPPEHKDKPIVICLCFGGNIDVSIRQVVSQFTEYNTKNNIVFEEWNGDKIAEFILKYFFNEELAPESYRSLLRKSIAMLDEPDTAIQYYKRLVDELCSQDINDKKDVLNILRQLNIYTWMLFAWSRDINNLESPYICTEYVLLKAWDISKIFLDTKGKNTNVISGLIYSLITLHLTVAEHYIDKVIVPTSNIYLGLSRLVNPSCAVDVNLKMFDLLGRVSLMGIWAYRQYCLVSSTDNNEVEEIEIISKQYHKICQLLILMIDNNEILLTPYKDDQATDIMLAVFCLSRCEQYLPHIESWLQELVYLTSYNFATNQTYLSNIQEYEELIRHPLESTKEYREKVTKGSTLLLYISLVASIYDFKKVYSSIQKFHNDFLNHTNIQLYFFDDESEEFLYSNNDIHGASLSGVDIQQSADKLFNEISDECKLSNDFIGLSAIKYRLYPIVLMACRHYRLPFPAQMVVQSKANR